MPASIFQGTAVKILKNILRFKDNTEITSTEVADYLSARGDQHEPTGFPDDDRAYSAISFVNGTRTFTIQPTVVSYTYYIGGIKYTKSAASTVVIPNTEGLHFISFNGATLESTMTFTSDLFKTHAIVAIIYWDATNSQQIYLGDERHGLSMDWATHLWLHQVIGTAWISGGVLGGINADASGNLDSSAQFSNAATVIADEDYQISHSSRATTDNISIYYKSGASGVWRVTGASDSFPVETTGTGRIAWNEFTGGAWQLTEVTNLRYALAHIFATNDLTRPYVSIMGQSEYSTIALAQVGAIDEISSLVVSGLPFAEFKPMGTIIFQTADTYTNSVKARIRSTDTGDDYVDLRQTNFSPSVAPSSHSDLANLDRDDHLQYLLRDEANQSRLYVFKEQNVPYSDWNVTGLSNASFSSETTTPISGSSSYKLTNAVGAATEVLYSPSVAVELRSTNRSLGLSFPYTYTGTDGAISAILQLSTDGTTFTNSAESEVDLTSSASTILMSTAGFVIDTIVAARLLLYINTGEAAVLTFNDVDISDDPFKYKNLVELGEWVPYTPTGSWSTNTTYSGYYRRVGDTIECRVKVLVSGAPTADNLKVSLPSGLSINTSKLFAEENDAPLGIAYIRDVSVMRYKGEVAYGDTAQRVSVHYLEDSGTLEAMPDVSHTTPMTFANGDEVHLYFSAPIAGWEVLAEHVVTPSTEPRSYSQSAGDFTITSSGTAWTTQNAEATYYVTSDGSHRLKFNISGTLNTTTAHNLTFSGVTFKNVSGFNQALAGVTGGAIWVSAYATANSNTLILNAGSTQTDWRVSGDVVLESRPTWAAPVSSQYLSVTPHCLCAIVKDVKPNGTTGGTFTSGAWRTRTLNTVQGDTGIVSLASNQVTLQPGKYFLSSEMPAYSVGYNKCRLANITDGTFTYGMVKAVSSGVANNTFVESVEEITSPKVYELQHYCQTTNTDGFGFHYAAAGGDEVYAIMKIIKLW